MNQQMHRQQQMNAQHHQQQMGMGGGQHQQKQKMGGQGHPQMQGAAEIARSRADSSSKARKKATTITNAGILAESVLARRKPG